MMWVNAQTTGEPLLFGYQVLWGRSHDLGFHRAPWGIAHTPARGLELINLYFLRLQTYLYESSIPSLAPALGALYLTPKVDRFDRYLLASAALVWGCTSRIGTMGSSLVRGSSSRSCPCSHSGPRAFRRSYVHDSARGSHTARRGTVSGWH